MGNYVDLTTIKNLYLYGIDVTAIQTAGGNIDAMINMLLPIAKAEMDRFMGQAMDEQTRTVRIDGAGLQNINLPNFPIKTVTSCKIFNGWSELIYEFQRIKHIPSRYLQLAGDSTSADADLMVDRDTGRLQINPRSSQLLANVSIPLWDVRFGDQSLNIEVIYTHGFPSGSIPEELKAAQGMLVAIMLGEMAGGKATQGANSVRIGSVSRTWGTRRYGSLFDSWMSFIEMALQAWRQEPYRIGGFHG